MKSWVAWLNRGLDLFLTSPCPLCHRSLNQQSSTPGSSLQGSSTPISSSLISSTQILCSPCYQQLVQCRFDRPQQFWQPPLPIFAWGAYSGTLKRSLTSLKYNNQPRLARPLGYSLAQAWLDASPSAASLASPASPANQTTPNRAQHQFPPKPLAIVPIPIHAERRQQRGFNQADLLAEAFCEITRFPLYKQGLQRIRSTEAQFQLSAQARQDNLTGAFALGKAFLKRPPAHPVLLLDDIYTTGATARSAIQVLRRSGISVYGLIVVAKAGQPQ